MATKTDDLEDIPIEKGSLNFMIGQMTGSISSLSSRVTALEGRIDRLDNRLWGIGILVVIGIGMQILFQVME